MIIPQGWGTGGAGSSSRPGPLTISEPAENSTSSDAGSPSLRRWSAIAAVCARDQTASIVTVPETSVTEVSERPARRTTVPLVPAQLAILGSRKSAAGGAVEPPAPA
jgi:hypothetical protein